LNRSPARAKERDLLFSAYLGLAALLPRLYVAIAWAREPVWDGHYYDFGARRIAAGFGYSDGLGGFHPWCHWPVGYSGFLAAFYRVFGGGPHVATIVNAVTGALLAVFTHRLARYELGRGRARIAGILCAVHPGLLLYTALVMTELLSALHLVVAGWLFARDRERHPLRGSILFGLMLGAGVLVHPSFLAYAPALLFLSAGPLFRDGPRWPAIRRALANAAIATVCMFVPVLPWTLRNCRVMDRCTLVSTNGGWNLAIGSFSRATGRFETLRSSDGCAIVTGQVQQDACWRDLAIATIRSDFGRWLGLIPKKLGFTFDHESFPIEYLREADPERWPEDRRRWGRGFLTGAHRIWLTAAALGTLPIAWRARRGRSAPAGRVAIATTSWLALAFVTAAAWLGKDTPFFLLAAAIALIGAWNAGTAGVATRFALFSLAGTIVTHAVFFGEDRYHVVIVPMLCLLAARAFYRHAEPTFNSPHIR
jgi:4-amino-4-deoxy-L-arabinose transferase-like glycosyltransferase